MDEEEWSVPLRYKAPVPLRTSGDEWLNRVHQQIAELPGVTGVQMSREGTDTFRITPKDGQACTTSLMVTHARNGLPECAVAGTGERRPDQVQLWQRIVKEATRQLGASRDFQWHAVIGEHPEAFTSPPQVLSGTRRVGTIDLQPSGNAFMELTGPLAAFGTGQIARTFLVRVSGTASGYDLEAAKLAAEYDLNLLCSLLALVSGRLWISRWPLTMDPQASLGFPITPPGQDNVAEGGPYPAPKVVEIDRGFEEAWEALQADRGLADLVTAYRESLSLAQDRHPSYSLLAAVGIIEAFGEGAEASKCEKCENVPGAAARFRQALNRVVDEATARRLAKVYSQRSDTAHKAVLHGMEPHGGAMPTSRIYTASPNEQFTHTVRAMQQAAAKLLIAALGEARGGRAASNAEAKRRP
ncbi:hypothetical protein [Actinoplanes digitatis]|uniref:Apea-like HEPN domain-containing protein n=1 Tax=Actinoplanes digitatis TaxID=1868 RepID=A0A7W7I7C8_9ACTN|nr:hypothetical protein [Actinoplanes digitatis]MBB4767493.1 hypothetical protein [Actinoplanes digitatis]